jgi:hypothetical protein
MNLIRLNPTRWPYSLQQLREDEPGRSFSASPRASELAYFQVFAVQPQAQPAYDPDLQKVMEVMPVLVAGQWQQQWEVVALTEEEQAELYRATHPPRWVEFGEAVTSDLEIAQLYETAPRILAHSLTGGLLQAVNTSDPRTFASAWGKARAAGLVSAQLLAAVQAMAAAHDLPAEFVEGLA